MNCALRALKDLTVPKGLDIIYIIGSIRARDQ